MNHVNVKAGDIVVSDFTGYQHWSIVTDKFCSDGKPMLISATKRNKTVEEEPWDTVTKGAHTYVAELTHSRTVQEIIENARSQIGQWSYSLTTRNCEHFVKWATGLEITSKQVKAGVGTGLTTAAVLGLCSENPKFAKILGWSVALGGLAVLYAKATEKKAD